MSDDKENIEQEKINKHGLWKRLLGLNPTYKLTSAIDGTGGTTVIDGNVTLANNLTNQNVEITNGSLIANSATDYIGSTNNLTIKNNGILDLSSEDKSINTVTLNNLTVDNSATNAHVR